MWEYVEPEPLFGDFTTKTWRKIILSKIEDSRVKCLYSGNGIAFYTEDEYQNFLRRFCASIFLGYNKNQLVVWCYYDELKSLPLQEWEAVDAPVTTRKIGALPTKVKIQEDHEKHQVILSLSVPNKPQYVTSEGVSSQPTFHWARANGWAILILTEVLKVLPKNHSEYANILAQYRAHIQGIVNYQSGEGFWHQLLDRNDSYLETSATAIFVYCIARGINEGWIDPIVYGPVAQLACYIYPNQSKRSSRRHLCRNRYGIRSGFYYYRPVNNSPPIV